MYFRTIEYRCRAIKNTLGIFDHYFLVIDDKEIHMGFYQTGKILPKDTTKGAHIVAEKALCEFCYNKIIADINLKEDVRLISYYPLLNCETLATGFSVQSLAFLSLPVIVLCLIKGLLFYAFLIVLCTILVVLMYSKYVYSRTTKLKCCHIDSKPKNSLEINNTEISS